MAASDNYLDINRQSWNARVDAHLSSEFYDMKAFRQGASSLKSIELELLGDIRGKKILHLQCHFGQDSLSLARMGAEVTGVDLSDKAISTARELASELGIPANFICCDIMDLPAHLHDQFDIVFTSYGTIIWLEDLNSWGKLISGYLKQHAVFIMAEFHPVLWMFDDDFEFVKYNYFRDEPIIEEESGTYADREADMNLQSITWNHSLSEVFQALIGNGLEITSFEEFDYSPYDCVNKTTEPEPGKFRVEHLGSKLPMVFSIKAVKTR